MGKSFKENYFEDDTFGKKKGGSNHKITRQKVRDFLKHIDGDEEFDEDFDIEKEVNK
jgi:hypothetical protein